MPGSWTRPDDRMAHDPLPQIKDVSPEAARKAASALNRPPVEVVRRSHKADAKHGEADLAEIAVRNADARRHKADSGAAHRCGKQPVEAQITAPQRPGGKDDRNAKADLMDKRTDQHIAQHGEGGK